jgi:hypothetical protein
MHMTAPCHELSKAAPLLAEIALTTLSSEVYGPSEVQACHAPILFPALTTNVEPAAGAAVHSGVIPMPQDSFALADALLQLSSTWTAPPKLWVQHALLQRRVSQEPLQ